MLSKNRRLLFFLILVCIFVATYHSRAATSRLRFTINDGWHFIGSNAPDGQKSVIDTAAWEKISLPHTWNIADTLDDEPGYRRGISWYRKQFRLGPELNGKRIFLYFEGVNQTADVFVNEKLAGRHIGGYTAFVFDITGLAKEASNLRNIFGTDQDAVAQTAREGAHTYRFDVADGEYEVELWFAELKAAKSGERVFDVSINAGKVISGLDLAKEVGPFTLLSRKFRASARDKSGVRIDLQPVTGQPIIGGLRVRRIN